MTLSHHRLLAIGSVLSVLLASVSPAHAAPLVQWDGVSLVTIAGTTGGTGPITNTSVITRLAPGYSTPLPAGYAPLSLPFGTFAAPVVDQVSIGGVSSATSYAIPGGDSLRIDFSAVVANPGSDQGGAYGQVFFTPLQDVNYTLTFFANVTDNDRGRSRARVMRNARLGDVIPTIPPKGLASTGVIVETGTLLAADGYADLAFDFRSLQAGDPANFSGYATLTFSAIPEPTALTLLAPAGLLLLRRSRQ